MAIKAIDPGKTETVFYPDDILEPRTGFEIGMIPGRVMDKVMDDLASSDTNHDWVKRAVDGNAGETQSEEGAAKPRGLSIRAFQIMREMVRYGLRGVHDGDGLKLETVSVNIGGRNTLSASEKTLDSLPRSVLVWLGGEIMSRNMLTEPDKGN